nr:hemolysin III family protein [Butyrivibrio sp. WCE2006]
MQISLREPGSSLTHLAAMFLTAGAGLPLLLKAADFGKIYVLAMLIFVVSMILLYGSSAFYHAITLSPQIIRIFRKIDHSMIFILIAGSYTPVCIIILNPTIGMSLLIAVWTLAFLGILLKLAWINCPLAIIYYIYRPWMECYSCYETNLYNY